MNMVANFVAALRLVEETGDIASMPQLFAHGARISNPLVAKAGDEQHAAKSFWQNYVHTFEKIRTRFLVVEAGEGTAFLEWRSEGRVGGQSFQYDGVSVIEFGEDGITAFRAYFDPRQLSIRPGSSERKSADSELVEAQRQAGEERAGGGYS